MATVDPTSLPLPTGWISEFDKTQNAWYFVDTTKAPPLVTWADPRIPAAAPAAAATSVQAAAPAQAAPVAVAVAVAPSAVPAGVTGVAPGEPPLPAGWSNFY
jgi:hypothetical protein